MASPPLPHRKKKYIYIKKWGVFVFKFWGLSGSLFSRHPVLTMKSEIRTQMRGFWACSLQYIVTISDGMTSYTACIFRLSRDNLLLRKKLNFYLIKTFTALSSSCNILCYWYMNINSSNIIPTSPKKKKRMWDDRKECSTLSGLKADIV